MKLRKHHNNKGNHKVKTDKCSTDVKRIAEKLHIKYKE